MNFQQKNYFRELKEQISSKFKSYIFNYIVGRKYEKFFRNMPNDAMRFVFHTHL